MSIFNSLFAGWQRLAERIWRAWARLVSPLLRLLVWLSAAFVGFVIVFLVVQQFDGNVTYPRIVGSSVGLPPIWVLVAVTVGGGLMGIFGMLFFIPLSSLLYTLLRTHALAHLDEKGIAPPTRPDEGIKPGKNFYLFRPKGAKKGKAVESRPDGEHAPAEAPPSSENREAEPHE